MTLTRKRAVSRPQGLVRVAYRAPIWLYRIGLGWLLGRRFLLLLHTGRRSGATRTAVLEVIRYDQGRGAYLVASGFGESSDWFRNLMAQPSAQIQVGLQRSQVLARRLGPDCAAREMCDYGHRNPRAAKMVAGLIGYELDGTDEDLSALARIVPLVELLVQKES